MTKKQHVLSEKVRECEAALESARGALRVAAMRYYITSSGTSTDSAENNLCASDLERCAQRFTSAKLALRAVQEQVSVLALDEGEE